MAKFQMGATGASNEELFENVQNNHSYDVIPTS